VTDPARKNVSGYPTQYPPWNPRAPAAAAAFHELVRRTYGLEAYSSLQRDYGAASDHFDTVRQSLLEDE